MLVRLEQSQKASYPIEVTELGISMFVRLEQPEKAEFPIEVTELGIIVYSYPEIKVFVAVSIMALLLSLLS